MPDSLISNHRAYVTSLRGCPSCSDRLSVMAGMRSARSAILAAQNRVDNTNGWLSNLLNRRHPNIVAVALANKNVRTVWALLAHGREFSANYAPQPITA